MDVRNGIDGSFALWIQEYLEASAWIDDLWLHPKWIGQSAHSPWLWAPPEWMRDLTIA